jgi:hypothetical protein
MTKTAMMIRSTRRNTGRRAMTRIVMRRRSIRRGGREGMVNKARGMADSSRMAVKKSRMEVVVKNSHMALVDKSSPTVVVARTTPVVATTPPNNPMEAAVNKSTHLEAVTTAVVGTSTPAEAVMALNRAIPPSSSMVEGTRVMVEVEVKDMDDVTMTKVTGDVMTITRGMDDAIMKIRATDDAIMKIRATADVVMITKGTAGDDRAMTGTHAIEC